MEVENRIITNLEPVRSGMVAVDRDLCKSLARKYVITQLRRNNFNEIANTLPKVKNVNDHVHMVVQEIADTLVEERGGQFEDMLNTLNLDDSSIEHTYDTIMYEMFKDTVNWGKIVTFIAFSAHMAVYCAKTDELQHRVKDIVSWADKVMKEKLEQWIEGQGGLQDFVSHYDTENWRVNLSSAVLALGVTFVAFAGGFLTLRKLFT